MSLSEINREVYRTNNPQRSISFFERILNYIEEQIRYGYLVEVCFGLIVAGIIYGIYLLVAYLISLSSTISSYPPISENVLFSMDFGQAS